MDEISPWILKNIFHDNTKKNINLLIVLVSHCFISFKGGGNLFSFTHFDNALRELCVANFSSLSHKSREKCPEKLAFEFGGGGRGVRVGDLLLISGFWFYSSRLISSPLPSSTVSTSL
jgi:hypothetical protein